MKTTTVVRQIIETHPKAVELFKIEFTYTQVEVMEITGHTEDELSRMVFEEAEEFLKYQGCDDFYQTQISTAEGFWGAWKQIWYKADRAFLRDYFKCGWPMPIARCAYAHYHNPKSAQMNTEFVAQAYHSFIKTLIVKR